MKQLLDSCVLIDILDIDESIIRLLRRECLPCFLDTMRLEELQRLDKSSICDELCLIESSMEEIAEANRLSQVGKLSMYDYLFLIEGTKGDYTLFTNDKRLRSECLQHRLDVRWGLEIFHFMAEHRLIDKKRAIQYAYELQKNNPFHVKDEHIEQLKEMLDKF